jgi:hypothetical protein
MAYVVDEIESHAPGVPAQDLLEGASDRMTDGLPVGPAKFAAAAMAPR